ncbi:MAG: glycosyltransferase family 32 protein [Bradyrhizobium sp.]|uniref:glycosyltransferase family 32 protein n=1 Tax=Bradyrhizobium sp. TaxID=376 RepID=UPI003D0F8B76
MINTAFCVHFSSPVRRKEVSNYPPDPGLDTHPGSAKGQHMSAAIPIILHQLWREAELPPPYSEWRAGWIANHAGWAHRLYDDEAIRRITADRAPQWLPTFEALPRAIQRVDFFRYLIVYLDGGMYADLDMISYQPCDPLLAGASCVLGIENHISRKRQQELNYERPWQLANFIFAAAPEHPFLASLLEAIARQATTKVNSDHEVQEITGPRLLTRIAYGLPPDVRGPIRVLPQINWNPPSIYPRIGPLAGRIYARHLCLGGWRTRRHWWQQPAEGRLGHHIRPPNPFALASADLP